MKIRWFGALDNSGSFKEMWIRALCDPVYWLMWLAFILAILAVNKVIL